MDVPTPPRAYRKMRPDSAHQREMAQVFAELEERRAAFAAREWDCTCAKPRPSRMYFGRWGCHSCGRLIH